MLRVDGQSNATVSFSLTRMPIRAFYTDDFHDLVGVLWALPCRVLRSPASRRVR